jgi:hypothetical protein
MKIGYTGWFNWPPIYCVIKDIKGDTLVVETEDGQTGEIKAIEFTPKYMIRTEEK